MKKGIWNEIVYRLVDKGIKEDSTARYNLCTLKQIAIATSPHWSGKI